MVYYRTYRPQKISDLDKTDVRERLSSVFSHGEVPHAFLFIGPRGTGKTSAARIVAKMLNCSKLEIRDLKVDTEGGLLDDVKEEKTTRTSKHQKIELQHPPSNFQHQISNTEPCNRCENCLAIAQGNHIDVYEIDAASNRGIDEIRDLRERISLSPAMGKKKVYIIDEVHMLTTEAFNALLKTLEEPPAHVSFILATTEAHKLPKTIVSRCFVLRFSRASDEEIIRSLRRVVTGEKLAISDDALSVIARAADGSFRDATKLLEQAASEGKFETNEIEKLTGAYFDDAILQLLSAKKTKKALEYIQQREKEGVDFNSFIAALIEQVHGLLLAKHGIKNYSPRSASYRPSRDGFGEAGELRVTNYESLTNDDLQMLIKLLSRAYLETKTSFIPSLPLELAVIEYCSA